MNNRINILDKETSNRIAAGEVVERPASAIKELIENSMDALSSSITVEIKKGGIDYIRITDNGQGIHRDDVESAFLRHATSKISSGHDLNNITTLGFRGEALPSIAAVSEVEMYTRNINSDFGSHIILKSGEIIRHTEYGCPEGTTIIVQNMFFNTPARKKFLKKESVEAGYITDVVSRLSFANPGISFKYIKDGNTVFHTPGDGNIDSAIRAVYGNETGNSLLMVEHNENKISIKGFIGKPEIAKANRSFQTVIVNGRYIHSSLVSAAVSDAMDTSIMINKYPLFVLHINIDPKTIDVNVHPNKYEIRFQDNQAITQAVFNAVKKANHSISDFFTDIQETQEVKTQVKIREIGINPEQVQNTGNISLNNIPVFDEKIIFKDRPFDIIIQAPDINVPEYKKEESMEIKVASKEAVQIKAELEISDEISSTIIGQLFSTYIIVQKDDEAFIIDQHAAHERLLYERLRSLAQKTINKQELLVPYVYDAGFSIAPQLEEVIPQLTEIGFEIEPFGQYSYQIRTIPVVLGQINFGEFFSGLSDLLKNSRKLKQTDLIQEELMMMSCKAAIKAGQQLDIREMDTLLKLVAEEEIPLTCPHGRPIMLRLSRTEIEKRFKRIQ